MSASAAREGLVVLRQALEVAVTSGLITRNPASSVRIPSPRREIEKRALDAAEIRRLLNAASQTRLDAPLRLSLAVGLRQGELLALRWDDVDLTAKTLRIQRSVHYLSGRGHVVAPPKTANSKRTIELSDATVTMLRAHRSAQREQRMRLGPAWQEQGLMFPSTTGTMWIARNLYREYVKVLEASDLNDGTVTFHSLRHTAASQWIRAGADIFSVSRRLGHASASFTMDVYAHLLSGQQTRAAEALDSLIAVSADWGQVGAN